MATIEVARGSVRGRRSESAVPARRPDREALMFDHVLSIGRIRGVRIELHWSLIVIAGLLLVHLGAAVFPGWHPGWSASTAWGAAALASVVFFASVLLHELAHTLMALAYGIPVKSITLFLLGGVSNIEAEPETPSMEAAIALVGPVVSGLIGAGLLMGLGAMYPGAAELARTDPAGFLGALGPIETALLWVAPVNLILAAFNLLPAFPLDGGRVLRAVLWGIADDLPTGTRWAAVFSRMVAWGLIALGAVMALGVAVPLLGSGLLAGLWLVVLGWFVLGAAQASYEELLARNALGSVQVGRLMRARTAVIDARASLESFSRDYLRRGEAQALPVIDDGRFVGLVRGDELDEVPRSAWAQTRVTEIMTPAEETPTVHPRDPAAAALDVMLRWGVDQVPVVDDGALRGIVRREDLRAWLRRQAPEARVA